MTRSMTESQLATAYNDSNAYSIQQGLLNSYNSNMSFCRVTGSIETYDCLCSDPLALQPGTSESK